MLHLVNKSPFERTTLEACLKRAARGSAILLFEDAVYAAVTGTAWTDQMTAAARQFDVSVLLPDLAVRGMSADQLVEGVRPVDYDGFVDLTVQASTIQSWL